MRRVKRQQLRLGETDLANLHFDLLCRDDIPKLLMGLQHIYTTPELRNAVFGVLAAMIPPEVDCNNGRPGMDLWNILVLGTLRLNLNCDYDRLQDLANNHKLIRQVLGYGLWDDDYSYRLQTLKDNVSLFTPEILDEINQIVVPAGHQLLGGEVDLRGKCNSFVVETDVHYPTDINLLFDATRKVIHGIAVISTKYGYTEWRKSQYNIRKAKKLFRKAQKLKRSTSKDPKKKAKKEQAIVEAHQDYLDLVSSFLERVLVSKTVLQEGYGALPHEFSEIDHFIGHAERQIDQIRRRVIEGEIIPHDEKVFSLFEEHTEWISKGKAGVPVELGLRVCVLEDQYGFLLHHDVMQKKTDDEATVPMVEETLDRFPRLIACSFDKGFYTPENRDTLGERLQLVVLPKKGKLSQEDQKIEYSEEFVTSRRRHSAVESAINALEVHGLDVCPDHGIDGFKRYVALAIVARNVQKVGEIIRNQKRNQQTRQNQLRMAA
jgi:IS5 family transposase